jgi:glycerol kinase
MVWKIYRNAVRRPWRTAIWRLGLRFAQGSIEKGMGKITYGTGSPVMINSGKTPELSRNVVRSLAWGINGAVDYVLEGNINCSGAAITWLIEVGLIGSAREAAFLAAGANRDDATCLVPAFSAIGAEWMAGMASGLYPPTLYDTMKRRRYTPLMDAPERERRLADRGSAPPVNAAIALSSAHQYREP